MPSMILTGDVNLMNVADPAVPFARVAEELRAADLVFANLECCLYQPPGGHTVEHEGFFADPLVAGKALKMGGIAAVGLGALADAVDLQAALYVCAAAPLVGLALALGLPPERARRQLETEVALP